MSGSASICTFCAIAVGQSTASIVFEDEHSLCFLDKTPLFPGHCLLIPRQHYSTYMQLPADLLPAIMSNAQRISVAVQSAMSSQGVFIAMNNVVSQSVPHLHVHIVPRNKGDGLKGFFWPRQHYDDAVHQEGIRQRIAELINA